MSRTLAGTVILTAAMTCLPSLLRGDEQDDRSDFNPKVNVGDKAPAWNNLKGVDGKRHSLSDLKEKKLVVVGFTCNHCPVAQAYEERFIKFAKDYKDKGVEFVAVNCNTIPADDLDAMKKRAKERGFTFTYLYDPTQDSGKGFGAIVTPHVFVLDDERKIAYMGAFDDSMAPNKVKHQYVKDAVEALLKGEKPEVTATLQSGCAIIYNKRSEG